MTWSAAARAQQATGYDVERFYPSAPGAGWFVMDELDVHGAVGGAMNLALGYDHDALVVGSGAQRLAVVSDRFFANFGAAFTYDRFRFYLNFDMPFVARGTSGIVSGATYTAPSLDPSTVPDPLSDIRFGMDVRLFGDPHGPFRFGAGVQVFYPSGRQQDWDTDATFHAMLRLLFAGTTKHFSYAGQLGAHLRRAADGPELLFGAAAGPRFSVAPTWDFVIGPEVFGATALRATDTAFEALLSARFEGTRDDVIQLRVKLGVGTGSATFGAPDVRVMAAIEMFNHNHD